MIEQKDAKLAKDQVGHANATTNTFFFASLAIFCRKQPGVTKKLSLAIGACIRFVVVPNFRAGSEALC